MNPPLGLWMLGAVRQPTGAMGYEHPLEVGVLVLEQGSRRAVICGIDILSLDVADAARLTRRVAEATGAAEDAVLVNFSHTHHAPAGGEGPSSRNLQSAASADELAASARFCGYLHDLVVSLAREAADRLEPAGVVWGTGTVDLSNNRRQRTAAGVAMIGWHPEGLLDNQVVVLQLRRADESAIATVVAFGCHPVTTSIWDERLVYSADYPGPMRDLVRSVSGGDCIFLQGAGGNVMPHFAFSKDLSEPIRVGRRLGLEALHAVADRAAGVVRLTVERGASANTFFQYFRAVEMEPDSRLDARRRLVELPLMQLPTFEELAEKRERYAPAVRDAQASGDVSALKVARYWAAWVERTEQLIRSGEAPSAITAPIHAVRIGDGVIVTGPGEVFTEIGMAVKERSPATPTMYIGYTNGIVSYLPTAAEYPFDGYEVSWAQNTWSLPAQVAPESERLLTETGVRLVEELFPEAQPWPDSDDWTATGALAGLVTEPLKPPEPPPA
jgi:hypothetical protein